MYALSRATSTDRHRQLRRSRRRCRRRRRRRQAGKQAAAVVVAVVRALYVTATRKSCGCRIGGGTVVTAAVQ